jgi:hypothetical protein
MPRLIFLIFDLLAFTPAGFGFQGFGGSGLSTDSGWEMDPDG